MKRYRWYKTEWPLPIHDLAKELKSNFFSQESNEGFIVDSVRKDYIDCRFVEKIHIKDELSDPFGNVIVQERVDFLEHEFRISKSFPGFELLQPQRSVGRLVNKLLEICEFKLSFSRIVVDPITWVEEIALISNLEMKIDSMHFSDVYIDENCVAKVITSSPYDVKAATISFLEGKKKKLKKVKVSFDKAGNNHMVLSDNGAAAIKCYDPEMIAYIRKAIASCG
ncbi:hypothetical protein [Alloalcanivorax xenomutans]|uniref:hypothetical protein n=1 Tax=Alloalcanivorax xenomutans TaxID=1094342 RepID=UPI0024E1A081|nr:hypothetical protein [Alloalcanivorax xenomutans]